MPVIDVKLENHVAVLTINRPYAGNSVNGELLRDFLEIVLELGHDDEVRAFVTTATGRIWCSGVDHAVLGPGLVEGTSGNKLFYGLGETGLPRLSKQEQLFDPLGPGRWILACREIEKPFIAAVNGAVAGGGLGLLGLHDYRIAADSARFRAAFIGLGVGPDFGASWFLPRLMGPSAATRFFLENSLYSAKQALETGLVHQVVTPEQVLATAVAMAESLAALPPLGVRATIRALRRTLDNSLTDQLALEWRNQDIAFASRDARRALHAFRNGTQVNFEGA
ncbi:enoyl-CoA hydratase/isomerase family protein [Nocardia sp. NPDC059246]|uniref:enoyl-CoA hydratase/isomerase family protein n=1 Tax=unclassified Nocardia TaxID=2637762 RepID=UPI0036C9017D